MKFKNYSSGKYTDKYNLIADGLEELWKGRRDVV